MVAKHFTVIDSFDTHARIPEHFENVNKAAKEGGNAALISCGWDPGMFSLQRVFAESICHRVNPTPSGAAVSARVTPTPFVVWMA